MFGVRYVYVLEYRSAAAHSRMVPGKRKMEGVLEGRPEYQGVSLEILRVGTRAHERDAMVESKRGRIC